MGSDPHRERRLLAIFAADVAGYSRMMREDEQGTLAALETYRGIADGLISAHRGRIANTAGDSILAEFPRAVDAVRCALAIQQSVERAEAATGAGEPRLRFRIGVHVGDVVVRAGDLFGDGVNVAARLQALPSRAAFASRRRPIATPPGRCRSRAST